MSGRCSPGSTLIFFELLSDLSAADWARPTACPGWTVQDVATHVLGDHLGRLSRHRDGFQSPHPQDGEEFPVFLHRVNAEWVLAARRISPPLLIELLSVTGTQLARFWATLDIDALGEPVTWAGSDAAPVWLDAAREFTEYWIHNTQIAEAAGRPGPNDRRYLAAVVDTFLRALPHTLRHLSRPVGTSLQVTVTGPAGGIWTCVRTPTRWALTDQRGPEPDARLDLDARQEPDARLELDADTAWRLCVRGLTPDQARPKARVAGDQQLAITALQIVSIIR